MGLGKKKLNTIDKRPGRHQQIEQKNSNGCWPWLVKACAVLYNSIAWKVPSWRLDNFYAPYQTILHLTGAGSRIQIPDSWPNLRDQRYETSTPMCHARGSANNFNIAWSSGRRCILRPERRRKMMLWTRFVNSSKSQMSQLLHQHLKCHCHGSKC